MLCWSIWQCPKYSLYAYIYIYTFNMHNGCKYNMCINIYIYIYIYTCICIHRRRQYMIQPVEPVYTYVYIYTHVYVYMYICIYVYMYICIYVYMYICIYVYMYICIYVYMYICIYKCIYLYRFPHTYHDRWFIAVFCLLNMNPNKFTIHQAGRAGQASANFTWVAKLSLVTAPEHAGSGPKSHHFHRFLGICQKLSRAFCAAKWVLYHEKCWTFVSWRVFSWPNI